MATISWQRGLLAFGGAVIVLYQAAPLLLKRAFRIDRSRHDPALLPGDPLWIPGQHNKRLAARYVVPIDGEPAGVVLAMHGWGSSSSEMIAVVAPLTEAGLAVLLVDARCHGSSDDDDIASMPRFAEDIESALDWVQHSGIDLRSVVILGHSVGAGAALLAAVERQVAGVIAVASMAHPAETMQRWMARAGMPRAITRHVLWRMQRIIGRRFDEFAPIKTIERVRCPVLIIHGDEDETIPLTDAIRLHEAAGDKARILVVEGADHRSPRAFVDRAADITGFTLDSIDASQPPPKGSRGHDVDSPSDSDLELIGPLDERGSKSPLS